MSWRRLDPASPAIALVGVILGLDLLWSVIEGSTGPVTYGLIDEPAHLATCLVALIAMVAITGRRPSPPFVAAALIASVAIDIDHIPAYLGWDGLAGTLPRPYSHSLLLVLLLLGFAWSARGRARQISFWLAFGVAAHLFRDLATGPGVPFLWPLTDITVRIPYAVFAGVLALSALVASGSRAFNRRDSVRRRANAQPLPSAYPPSGS